MQAYAAEFSQGVYLITCDVVNRLQSFRPKGFTVPNRNHPAFRSFQRRFLKEMERILPDVTIRAIDMSDLMRSVRERVSRLRKGKTAPVVVSTCSDMASAVEGEVLSVNRLWDRQGEFLGHGPRPGFPSLDEQIEKLVRRISSRPVILVEDGVFTGKTLRFVIERLRERGVFISIIVVGFCCAKAEAFLREVFHGEFIVMGHVGDLVDWIPDHDLVPFVPHCGRVLGEEISGGFMPVMTSSGTSYAFPYILPFGKFGEWASLPPEGALELSRFCLDASIELFGCIGRKSGKPTMSIRELVQGCGEVSLPISIGLDPKIPSLDFGIVDFLRFSRETLG